MYIEVMDMLWIIPLALIAALILAALVPLRVQFRLSTNRNAMKVQYGPFRLINTEKAKQRARRSDKAEKAATGKKRKRKKRRLSLRGTWESLIQALKVAPGFGKAALSFAGRLFNRTELSDFSGRVAGGLGDPALTGMAAGWVHSLFGAVPRLGKYIVFEPDYLADWPVLEVSGRARFLPINAALPALQFIREAPLAKLYRLWRRPKAKKKSKRPK